MPPENLPRSPAPAPREAFRSWPVWVILAMVTAVVAWLTWGSLARNAGHVAYPLDDVYLHMAMARNLVKHGVWGTTRYGFTSTSSSPLWTLLLAGAYGLTGVREGTPLALTLLGGFGLLFVTDRVLARGGDRRQMPGWARLLTLGAMAGFMPLVPMVVSGMEHVLHAGLTLAFVARAARTLSASTGTATPRGETAVLAVLGALMTATRFEGLLAVALVAALLACRRRVGAGFTVGAAGVSPVVGYGLWSLAHGWWFLPNSIVLKANRLSDRTLPALLEYLTAWWSRLLENPHLLSLAVVALVLIALGVRRRQTPWTEDTLFLGLFLVLTLGHLQFAKLGWFYRYEAYLVCLGLVAVIRALWALWADVPLPGGGGEHPGRGRLTALAATVGALALTGPLFARAVEAHVNTSVAARNVFEQQYQMARFLRDSYPPGTSVAANDIGAINFLADIRCLDLFGLASMDVALPKRNHTLSTGTFQALATREAVRVAVVYRDWYEPYGGLPLSWVRVGEWTIPNNVICGKDTVAFYAVVPGEAPGLADALRRFAPELPGDVVQRFFLPSGEPRPGASDPALGLTAPSNP